MKRIAVVVVLGAALLWYATRAKPASHAPHAAPATGEVPASSTARAAGARPVEHVTALASADERRAVADRIAAAQQRRGALHAAAPPSLPVLDTGDLPAVKTTLKAAMHEVLSHLSDCYEASAAELPRGELRVVAKLTLTGDPDVGTLIDAHQLADGSGAPVPATFDDCVRGVLQSLELPPLAEGDTLDVTYPFMFSR